VEEQLQNIEKELEAIRLRNSKVEADKAWETSYFRKISIAIVTYIIAAVVMYFIGVADYLLNALIPTLGYILSTLSLPFIKNWWIKNRHTE
jgi:hypothetical protein